MNGPVNTIETYLKVTTPPDESGATVNFATYQSAIYGFAHADELKSIRRVMFPDRLPKLKPKLPIRRALHLNPLVQTWCMPFPGKKCRFDTLFYRFYRFYIIHTNDHLSLLFY